MSWKRLGPAECEVTECYVITFNSSISEVFYVDVMASRLAAEECGMPQVTDVAGPTILGGTESVRGKWPWMVSHAYTRLARNKVLNHLTVCMYVWCRT